MSFLVVEQLRKVFDDGTVAVGGIDLVIEEGEFVVLLGPSGCGKTTTLRMLAGLEDPTSGRIEIAGERVDGHSPARRDVGFVFQFYALYPHLSVAENVSFPLECDGVDGDDLHSRVFQVMEQMHLSHLAGQRPDQLSGGDQQRVALARAMVRKPRLWLMDEPLGTLDADLRMEMRELIRAQQRETGVTTIYVTHDQEEAMSLGDCVVVMERGLISQKGAPIEVYEAPENLFVAHFIGSPGMNFLKGRIDTACFAGSVDQAFVLPVAGAPEGDVTLGIRPEFVRAARGGPLPATVVTDEHLGRHRNVHLDTPLGRVVMRVGAQAGNERHLPGERIEVEFDSDHLCFFESVHGKRVE